MEDNDLKYTIEEYQLSVRGHNIFTKKIHQKGSLSHNYALVFLHDGLGSTESWGDFPFKLASETGLDALLYDRRGYGRSSSFTFSGNADYLKDEALHILPEILHKFKIYFPIFIGHSDGGTIALIFSGIYSQINSLIVSIAAHTFVEPVTISGIKDLMSDFNSGSLRNKLLKQHHSKTDPLFASWTTTWLGKDFTNYNIYDYLKKIKSSMLLIQGDKDEFGTAAQINSISEYSNAEKDIFMIENCGHLPHITHQTILLGKCKDFILNKLAH